VKRLVPLTAIVVLAMLMGCGKNGDTAGASPVAGDVSVAGIPVKKMTVDTIITAIDKEAAQHALDRYKPTKLGQSYYVYMIESMPNGTVTARTLFEIRNPQVQLSPEPLEPLTEADKLNGVSRPAWTGKVALCCDASRMYIKGATRGFDAFTPIPAEATWSKWGNTYLVAGWEKTNGKWVVDDLTDHTRLFTFKEAQASDLPKGK